LRKLQKNLLAHLKKAIRPTDKQVIIFDDIQYGRTEWIIRRTLKKVPNKGIESIKSVSNFDIGSFIGSTYTGSDVGALVFERGLKNPKGLMWADHLNYYAQKSEVHNALIQAPKVVARHKDSQKKMLFERRFAFNLGIAVAKEFLQTNG